MIFNTGKGLKGVLVLDLSSLIPGPYCTSLLATMGAEVCKIERPGHGDPARQNSPEAFASFNWGKKSLALDLTLPEGRNVFFKMAEHADVVVESYRPGVAARLGIDYSAVRAVNPKIVYCSISGFGQDGPYSQKPAHDINIQALCGLLSTNISEEGVPDPIPPLSDLTTGVFASLGILNALMQRQESGEGCYLDISMTDGPLAWMAMSQLVRFPTDLPTAKDGYDVVDRATPHYGAFKTRDGKLLALGVVHEDHLWREFCQVMEQLPWAEMDFPARLRAGQKMRDELRRIIRSKDQDEWLRLLEARDIPVTAVNSFAEAIQDPALAPRKIMRPTKVNGMNVSIVRNPVLPPDTVFEEVSVPQLGEHTLEFLQRFGFEPEKIQQLCNSQVV